MSEDDEGALSSLVSKIVHKVRITGSTILQREAFDKWEKEEPENRQILLREDLRTR